MTSPPGSSGTWAAPPPAALARGLGVMAGLAQGSPVRLVPEQDLISAVRHDVVDHRRRHHAALRAAGGAKRVKRQEGSARSSPARTVASSRRARTLAAQLAFHLCRASRPAWTVHGRLRGQRRLQYAKTRRGHAGGLIFRRKGDERRPYLVRGYPSSSAESVKMFSGLMFGRFCSATAFSRVAIFSSATVQRCHAVVRPIPNR
jgi:hypothetical protein